MTQRQFVFCTVVSCPRNKDKSCRSLDISVDEEGYCLKKTAPPGAISPTENYVEIAECGCEDCNFWEEDRVTGKGNCAIGETLSFEGKDPAAKDKTNELANGRPRCMAFDRQIGEPGWRAKL